MTRENKNSPKISIVIPIYNGEETIRETLDSLLNQTFQDFEIIIVDNGSTDNSLKILKEYQKNDKRFVIKSIPKPYAVRAANHGLKFARGKYISKIDGDDVYLPNKLQIQYDYLENNPEVFLVGSSAIIIDENGKRIGLFRKYNNPKKIKRKLLKSTPFIHSSIMYRNVKGLFYREKFLRSEERDLFFHLLEQGKILTNLPDILMKYRIRSTSIVSTKPNQQFYFDKAREFHEQRKKFGRDDYENLCPPEKKQKQMPFDKLGLEVKIFAELQDGKSKKVREDVQTYFKKYGFNKVFVVYYLLSLLPTKLIYFLQEKVF